MGGRTEATRYVGSITGNRPAEPVVHHLDIGRMSSPHERTPFNHDEQIDERRFVEQLHSRCQTDMPPHPRIATSFLPLLKHFEFDELDRDEGTIFGLWPDFTLAYFNLGWFRFAAANHGEPKMSAEWPLGRNIFDAISKPLHPFFYENYRRCLKERRPWVHLYECSGAQSFRQFHMTVYPLENSAGLLIVNSLIQEVAHFRAPCPPLEELYRNEHGIMGQCCHCRRMRRVGGSQEWDWVPAWIDKPPPNVSHGLCVPCLGFYYRSPDATDGDGFVQPFKTGP